MPTSSQASVSKLGASGNAHILLTVVGMPCFSHPHPPLPKLHVVLLKIGACTLCVLPLQKQGHCNLSCTKLECQIPKAFFWYLLQPKGSCDTANRNTDSDHIHMHGQPSASPLEGLQQAPFERERLPPGLHAQGRNAHCPPPAQTSERTGRHN